MLSEQHKKTAQVIVNIYETGSARGEYGQVTVMAGDSGHLNLRPRADHARQRVWHYQHHACLVRGFACHQKALRSR